VARLALQRLAPPGRDVAGRASVSRRNHDGGEHEPRRRRPGDAPDARTRHRPSYQMR
jgi:hypothetical protein